jgi:hypothetical protein
MSILKGDESMQDKDASAHHNSLQSEGSLPFFTRFLEGQDNTERSAATTKYPSDWDEIVTMKYPSDDDEGGDDRFYDSGLQTGGADNPGLSLQTLKYPSDRDEGDFT